MGSKTLELTMNIQKTILFAPVFTEKSDFWTKNAFLELIQYFSGNLLYFSYRGTVYV